MDDNWQLKRSTLDSGIEGGPTFVISDFSPDPTYCLIKERENTCKNKSQLPWPLAEKLWN